MIERTFCHLPKIGKKTEMRLWNDGIENQYQLFENLNQLYKGKRLSEMKRELAKSITHFEKDNLLFFYERLPRDELFRLAIGRMDQISFLDIETTGLACPPRCKTTTISVVQNGKLYQAHNRNGIKRIVKDILEKSPILCTYYGEVFDVPFLRKDFKSKLKIAHIDLCFWLRRLGYTGGLKGVQKQFKDIPLRKSQDLDGFDAVILWEMYRKGNTKALESLLTYNAEDTTVLCHLLEKAIGKEVKNKKYLKISKLEKPRIPKIRTKVDSDVYREVKSRYED